VGLLVNGQWHDTWYDTGKSDGAFVRSEAQFRHWITADGQAGPTGRSGFLPESGRYHLYVSLACPWAHRTLIFRALKGLEEHIDISVVHPDMLDKGWIFQGDEAARFSVDTQDHLFQFRYYHQIYTQADPVYTGRVTVPVLWDKHRNTIVSNESSEIIRMFNSAFNGLTGNTLDFYPDALTDEIDTINNRIYADINNGVYRAGFATTQHAYNEAVEKLFDALDWVDSLLADKRYLTGNQITEADWRLFTTLYRFDPVYVGHFKCNIRRIADYPNLSGYLRDLYQQPLIAETCNLEHCKRHYYFSHDTINPTRVVPAGPIFDYQMPHGRDRF
jgi:putative glutathione S-transferase